MIYLEEFRFPDIKTENVYIVDNDEMKHASSYFTDNIYPFYFISHKKLHHLKFSPITILYGGNGSGKSTILNVISRKLRISRNSLYNIAPWFDHYVRLCRFKSNTNYSGEEFDETGKIHSKYDISSITSMLTSDDIFKMVMDDRITNDQIFNKSRILQKQWILANTSNDKKSSRALEYQKRICSHLDFENGENINEYKDYMNRKNKSFNKYFSEKIGKMKQEFSNGESSLLKFSELIETDGLYILDEPENSLSSEFQLNLSNIILHAARYNNVQFIIATHSPFLLSLEDAKIYDLDSYPVQEKKWWELENMKQYFELFNSKRDLFLQQ